MTALGLRLQLSRLKRAHGVSAQPVIVPMGPPTAYSQQLSGYASTLDVDLVRMRFRPYAFGAVHRNPLPPLYFKHDTSREVGTIQSLSYDQNGALLIACRVTDPIARRCNAFSVSATVRDGYEIINADRPDFYALIKFAELTEVSVTDTPANPQARVHNRMDVCAAAEFYGAAQTYFERLSQMVALIQKGTQHGSAIG